jgi:hypothetical protein
MNAPTKVENVAMEIKSVHVRICVNGTARGRILI